VIFQEIASTAAGSAPESGFHRLLLEFVNRLEEGTEILSAIIIAFGIAVAAYSLGRLVLTSRRQSDRRRRQNYQRIRLQLSRTLALALEFQLAADVLGTTISPSWDQLGRLGAIAVIRTFLNFFLGREIAEEERDEETTGSAEKL